MLKLVFCLSSAVACCGAEVAAQQAFDQVRAKIARQLSAAANYTCVLTVDRSVNFASRRQSSGCANKDRSAEHPFMHDRLRLDVAVSEGREIFSWHGGRQFSTAGVDEIVKSGPISSGSFVGYLRNILFTRGVSISLDRGRSGDKSLQFDYYVPVTQSSFQVKGRRGKFIVPFYGSFSVRSDTFQLQSLSVRASEFPRESEVCAADTDVSYQNVQIAGKDLLVPSSFQLHLQDRDAADTWSQSQYTQCREFRGESSIRFDFDESTQAQSDTILRDEWLPAGMNLHVRLTTPLTDQSSFTGDPVEGVLLNSVHVRKLNITVPKGALLAGVVSRMELRYQPTRHYVVAIHWDRLTFGQNTLLLDANPNPLDSQGRAYGRAYTHATLTDSPGDQSVFVWPAAHFHMDRNFAAYYQTTDRPPEANNPQQ
jgi:hypothetical protein